MKAKAMFRCSFCFAQERFRYCSERFHLVIQCPMIHVRQEVLRRAGLLWPKALSVSSRRHAKTACLYDRRFVFALRSAFLGSANRTGAGASAARDAGIGIDHILAIAFRDCADRAFACACATGDAFISDNIRHNITPPISFPLLRMAIVYHSTSGFAIPKP